MIKLDNTGSVNYYIRFNQIAVNLFYKANEGFQ